MNLWRQARAAGTLLLLIEATELPCRAYSPYVEISGDFPA